MKFIKHYVDDLEVPASFEEGTVHEILRDGVVLCKLMNGIQESSVKRINDSKMAFKQMENIGNYVYASVEYGVPTEDQFQTPDLYEATNMAAVIHQIFVLGRKAKSKGQFGINPEEYISSHEGEFTEEQMRAGEDVVGLQMGSS